MGSVVYNFLCDSILFNESHLADDFKNVSIGQLEKELQNYRQHCIDNYTELVAEVQQNPSTLKVFSSARTTAIKMLIQTALYIEQHIINDPLFILTNSPSEMTNVLGAYLGFEQNGIDKKRVAQAANFLKKLTPMVVNNYVKVFPLNYHFEGPKDVPFTMPEDYYDDILPEELLRFFRMNALVRSMEKLPAGGWQVMENDLYPCRGIVVDFKGSDFSQSSIYHLMQVEFGKYDKETGRAEFRQWLPDTPPQADEFNAWVLQSINRSARAFFDRVYVENVIASNLNSTYLCSNEFTANLMSQSFDVKDNIQTYTANQILNIELPFLDDIDITRLMEVREGEADVFTTFRLELEKQFRELRTLTDENLIRLKTENIFHELNEVQGQKIKQKISHLQSQMRLNALLALGGLAGSIQTSGASLLATATAIGKGYKDYKDYQEKVKENPGYFLWRVLRKNK